MGAWSRGGTAGNEGLAWGWRVLSPRWRGLWGGNTPNTRPLDYKTANTDKVAVILTDGDNQVYDWPCQWTSRVRLVARFHHGCTLYWSERFRLHWLRAAVSTYLQDAGSTIAQRQGGIRQAHDEHLHPDEGAKASSSTASPLPARRQHRAGALQSLRHQARILLQLAQTMRTLRTVFRTIGVQLSNLRIAK